MTEYTREQLREHVQDAFAHSLADYNFGNIVSDAIEELDISAAERDRALVWALDNLDWKIVRLDV